MDDDSQWAGKTGSPLNQQLLLVEDLGMVPVGLNAADGTEVRFVRTL